MRVLELSVVGIFLFGIGYAVLSSNGFLVSNESLGSSENFLSANKDLPSKGEAPELTGIVDWINSPPLSIDSLKGKVILVDFWTYTCINCIRTLPHLTEWYEKYRSDGFVILGVHTPEFEFEKKKSNILAAIAEYDINYPVAMDNDYATWIAYQNRYWPAHYLIDAEGNIRYTHFGEGRYAEIEGAIQQLLLEAGLLSLDTIIETKEVSIETDFSKIGTPEIYLGVSRINNVGNDITGVRVNEPHKFTFPTMPLFNLFYFNGLWTIASEFSELQSDTGGIQLRYHASKVNMVMGVDNPDGVLAEIKIDGEYLTDDMIGDDVFFQEERSLIRVKESRLYNVVDSQGKYRTHTIEINILAPGLQVFTFTFG